MKIDIIIPAYKPGKALFTLLDRLEGQSVPVRNIILMNTGREHFEALIRGMEFAEKYPNVQVHHLPREEFDHGGTRHRGVQYSDAEIFLTMTQDALPADPYLVEKLV